MSKDNAISIEKEKQKDAQRQKPQPPPMYKVLLNNDDYTPMDFVIEVLMQFFNMDAEKANQLMLTVHYQGKSVRTQTSAPVDVHDGAGIRFFVEGEQYVK